MMNPLGTKGHLTQAFASILHDMWHEETPYLTPLQFRVRHKLMLKYSSLTSIVFSDLFVYTRSSLLVLNSMMLKSSSVFFWMVYMKISIEF